jgi:hypothetical protein
MRSPLGDRCRGMFRRHWLAVVVSTAAVALAIGVVIDVREKVAGFQLVATVGPAADPAALALQPMLDPEFELGRPPTLSEINRFFTQPGTRNRVGAYQTTDLDVAVDESREVIVLVVGDDLRERTELSLQLYLDGYLDQRRADAAESAEAVAVGLERLLSELEVSIAGTGDGSSAEVVAELEREAANLRAAVEAVRIFATETNGGVETSVLDVGGAVWRTSFARGLVSILAAAFLTATVVVVVASRDRRIRSRSDLNLVDPQLELLGALPFSAKKGDQDLDGLRAVLAARLQDLGAVAVVAIGCDPEEVSDLGQLLPGGVDIRVMAIAEPLDPVFLGTVIDADVAVVVVGWGRVDIDGVTISIGQIRGSGRSVLGVVMIAVPERELAAAFR